MKRTLTTLLCLLVSLLLIGTCLVGCASEPAPAPASEQPAQQPASAEPAPAEPAPAEPETKTIRIGVALPTVSDASWVALRDGFTTNVDAFNAANSDVQISLTVNIADGDSSVQSSQIMDMISAGQDVIFCAPVDSTAIWTSITECHNAGIPIYAINRNFSEGAPDPEDGSISWDMAEGVYIAVKANIEKMIADGYAVEDIKFVNVLGDLRDENAIIMRDSVYRALDEYGLEPAIEVESEWNEETLLNRLSAALVANPDVNATFDGSGDALLPAIASALDNIGKWVGRGEEGHVYCTSVSGGQFENTLEYVRDGYLETLAVIPFQNMAASAIEFAVEIVDGGAPTEVIIPPNICTPDNFQEYMDQGYIMQID